jgi:long-chain acyl-CoA synthetase
MKDSSDSIVFWRVEGSLLARSSVRAVAFFTENSQSFSGRWARRGAMALLTFVLPLIYLFHRPFATRVLHTLLCGVSRDRLDLLGEEYFQYVLKPRLKPKAVEKLQRLLAANRRVVLVSDGLDHVTRPLAAHLGVGRILANRLEFRDGHATGRLLEPVIPPRTFRSRFGEQGRVDANQLTAQLGVRIESLEPAVVPTARRAASDSHPLVDFASGRRTEPLSVRKSLAGKHILLVGGTGFIGKVWLANTLTNSPAIGKIYLLIRPQRSTTAIRRFEKIVEESPIFETFHDRYGSDLARFMRERVEVVEGDVSQPGLGLDEATRARLASQLDLIINSAGLTDFNPDLRTVLAINVDGMVHLIEFVRQCDHAALLHLSTCFVVGSRDGRVSEELVPNYTPLVVSDFDAERERQSLHNLVREIEQRAHTPAVTQELKKQALEKRTASKTLAESSLDHQVRKNRLRWVRVQMVEAGMRRARELGWPNTYCFTKSLGESLIARLGAGLPVAIVRPSITETSTREPFRGWNEGVNTSAPLSYLLGTYFRQLPSNKRKCLDLVPVDLVTRGMTLIAAALVERRHEPLYHLATSACNPCDMGRSIELTGLAHRKHYRAQGGFESQLRLRFDTISVSKKRFETFSAPRQKAMVRALRRLSSPIPFAYSSLVRKERDLERVEKLIELYEPFILHNEQVFEAQNVEVLSALLPPEEQSAFGYDPHTIDWWEYWINIHVPALRRWTFPLIEGRPLEARTPRPFNLDTRSQGAAT